MCAVPGVKLNLNTGRFIAAPFNSNQFVMFCFHFFLSRHFSVLFSTLNNVNLFRSHFHHRKKKTATKGKKSVQDKRQKHKKCCDKGDAGEKKERKKKKKVQQ
jgi:hypothetical protein